MKKRYPRRPQSQKFKGYYVAPLEMASHTTVAVDREIFPLISDIINSSKKSLCLAFFQFTLDEKHLTGLALKIFSSLKSRKDEGVDIRVVLNRKFSNGFQNRLNVKTAKLLSVIGIPVVLASSDSVLHTKMIIADGEKAVLGSMNMTATSLCQNHEVAVLIRSPLVKTILGPYFEEIWQRSRI